MVNREVSLYFHIPFCTKKCDYCHFYVLPNKSSFHELLMQGLLLDLDRWAGELKGKKLVSIYFGGGTPSLLGAESLSQLLEKTHGILPYNKRDIEITLEANPETINLKLMQDYAQAGVNRVSLGIQSLDDTLLKKLGRTHYASTALKAIETTAEAGISNISIDLMYDIPGQTLESWQQTLSQIAPLPITHLSLYNLTIEPHTVFFKYRESLLKELPDADCSADMYQTAVKELNDCGLIQYEISAFARDNLFSRHNVGYWTARPFLGLGPSAFSYWDHKRFRAIANLNRYVEALKKCESPIDFSEQLSPEDRNKELLAIALRMRQGVDLEKFQQQHGTLGNDTRKAIKRLVEQDLLAEDGHHLALTDQGVLFYDTIATDIV